MEQTDKYTNPNENIKSPEEILIESEFQALLQDYLNSKHRKKIEIITKAFNFANNAHKGARRRSGEPYIMHPLAVARIVAKEIGLGSTSICAALLHDVVEDTDYTVEDIANMFTPKIAQLVDGLTKISGGIFGEQASQQAESFRKLLLTMPDDIRVIIIKMADRLHNMRTLESMPQAKQFKIAGETLYIYAPLAHRLGLNRIKSELEDLAFKYEHPEAYKEIQDKIRATDATRKEVYDNFAAPIKTKLDSLGIKYEMRARIKSVYSIWSKMQTKNIGFDDVYDLLAARIIFEPREGLDEAMECWSIYSIITRIYEFHPERIRDWVSRPKLNGYSALHVTVMGPDGQWIEVQIRSRRMDDVAERGFAAHWGYKSGMIEEDSELNLWIHTVKEILENPEPNAIDFLDTVKMNLFSNEIFVCTPKGEFKTLPQGATALDFAFSLHSDVGYNCIGAKVNHKLVPVSHRLNSGDQIEVLTSKSQLPRLEWEHFVTTAKAKNKLALYFRKERRVHINKGEQMAVKFLIDNGFADIELGLNRLNSLVGGNKLDDLYYKIATGEIVLSESTIKNLKGVEEKKWINFIKKRFSGNDKKQSETGAELTNDEVDEKAEKEKKKKGPFVLEEDGLNKSYVLSDCCHPLPGDDALGYVNDTKRISIHMRSCQVAMRLKSGFGNQIMLVSWGNFVKKQFDANIELRGIDEPGVLAQISRVLFDDMHINIQSIHVDTKDGIFEGILGLKVSTIEDVKRLCDSLQTIKQIKTASRILESNK